MRDLHDRKRIQLLVGFLVGVAFGFLLQKGGLTEYAVIVNQLRLEDFTVLKVMFTAVVTGMVGLYLLREFGLIRLDPKPFYFKGIAVGGLVFGVGFALLGYCPGTAAGAIGSGSVHALLGAVGILIGAYAFSLVYPLVRSPLMEGGRGSVTVPDALDANPWAVVVPVSIAFLTVVAYFELF